jgi:hypothetical protein
MIFRVNCGFHGISFGAPAPVNKMLKGTDLGRSITQQARQNKPGIFVKYLHGQVSLKDLPAVAAGPIWGQQKAMGQIS